MAIPVGTIIKGAQIAYGVYNAFSSVSQLKESRRKKEFKESAKAFSTGNMDDFNNYEAQLRGYNLENRALDFMYEEFTQPLIKNATSETGLREAFNELQYEIQKQTVGQSNRALQPSYQNHNVFATYNDYVDSRSEYRALTYDNTSMAQQFHQYHATSQANYIQNQMYNTTNRVGNASISSFYVDPRTGRVINNF